MRIRVLAGAAVGRPNVDSQASVLPWPRSCEMAASKPIRSRPPPRTCVAKARRSVAYKRPYGLRADDRVVLKLAGIAVHA